MMEIIYTNRVKNQHVRRPSLHNSLHDPDRRFWKHGGMDWKRESGRRLKVSRETLGLTLDQLSRRVKGISPSRISNYEQGTRLMRQQEAVALGVALGVSAAYLMCIDEPTLLPTEHKHLLDLYNKSDMRGRRIIEQVAEHEARATNS